MRRRALVAGIVLASTAPLASGCSLPGGREAPEAFAPSWSPDGRSIAFLVDPDPSKGCPYGSCRARYEVWLMRSSGVGARRVVRGDAVTWAPDGKRLAVVRDGFIYSVRSDGSRLRRLSGKTYDDRDPAWSPDGKQIAFRRHARVLADGSLADAKLWVMNADGGGSAS